MPDRAFPPAPSPPTTKRLPLTTALRIDFIWNFIVIVLIRPNKDGSAADACKGQLWQLCRWFLWDFDAHRDASRERVSENCERQRIVRFAFLSIWCLQKSVKGPNMM